MRNQTTNRIEIVRLMVSLAATDESKGLHAAAEARRRRGLQFTKLVLDSGLWLADDEEAFLLRFLSDQSEDAPEMTN